MKAAVVFSPGGPEALEIVERPDPEPVPGEVVIRIRAFGLNRAELFTRQGDSGAGRGGSWWFCPRDAARFGSHGHPPGVRGEESRTNRRLFLCLVR